MIFVPISTIFWDIFLKVEALNFFCNISEGISEWEKYSKWLEKSVRSVILAAGTHLLFSILEDWGTLLGHLHPYIWVKTTQHRGYLCSIMSAPHSLLIKWHRACWLNFFQKTDNITYKYFFPLITEQKLARILWANPQLSGLTILKKKLSTK